MIAEKLGAGVDGGWDGVVQMHCSSHGAFGPGGQDCANVTKSQDHQLVCANSTTWAHLPMSGWRTHPQFCLPGQRWLPWPSPALKHIPGPNQCQCWRKRLASTNMHFRKRPVIRHRTPCWCPSKMPLISPLHIRWASSYQSLSQLRFTKKISRCTAAVSTVSPPSTTTLNCPQSPSLCQTSHTTYRLFGEINLFVVALEIYLVWMQLCRDLRKLWLWRSPIPRPLSHLRITGWPFSRELGHLILPHSSSKVQPQRGSILISSKSWKTKTQPLWNLFFSRGLWADTDIVCEGGQVNLISKQFRRIFKMRNIGLI